MDLFDVEEAGGGGESGGESGGSGGVWGEMKREDGGCVAERFHCI